MDTKYVENLYKYLTFLEKQYNIYILSVLKVFCINIIIL